MKKNKEKYRGPSSVTVREILVAEQDLADSLLALVRGGADLADLARRYTQREGLRNNGGLWENVSPGDPRSAGVYRAALRSEGPAAVTKVPGGYSLFKVLEKSPGPILDFVEVVDLVRGDVETSIMDRFIGDLKRQYRDEIYIDETALRAL